VRHPDTRAVALFAILVLLFWQATPAHAARVTARVPSGTIEVKLLSPGVTAVLDVLRPRHEQRLKASREETGVDRLEQEVRRARQEAERARQAFENARREAKAHAVSKIRVTVHKADVHISSESSIGEAEFFYTAFNESGLVVSDITYRPVVSGVVLPLTTPLTLEFIDPSNLLLGLGPQETITNQNKDPERLTFFLSDLSEGDRRKVSGAAPGDFSLKVEDMHFVARKGYKGQNKPMGIEEAYSSRLAPFSDAVQRAEAHRDALAQELARASQAYAAQTREGTERFRAQLKDLKAASVRAEGALDKKKSKAVFTDVPSGAYCVYAASADGRAAIKEVNVDSSRITVTIDRLGKDPFLP